MEKLSTTSIVDNILGKVYQLSNYVGDYINKMKIDL
jgi:hypothetical protein